MGHIVEPEGVDFTIESNPMTQTEKEELSKFIERRKLELAKKVAPNKESA